MASLTDLVSDVYTITNHPELVSETILAVKKATQKAHQREFYFKDLFETGIQFQTAAYYQYIEPKLIASNYRSLKYLRKYDAVNLCPGEFLTLVTPDDTFNAYHTSRTNIYYAAGAELNIRMNTQEQYMLMGIYVHPNVTDAGYSSWIADEYPSAVIYEAAASVFKSIGLDAQGNSYRAMAQEVYAMIDMANIQTIGS